MEDENGTFLMFPEVVHNQVLSELPYCNSVFFKKKCVEKINTFQRCGMYDFRNSVRNTFKKLTGKPWRKSA